MQIDRFAERHSAPFIPPTNTTLRPLVRMVAEAIGQFGAAQAGLLCLTSAQGVMRAVVSLRQGDEHQAEIATAAGVTERDLYDMALWLELRGVELCGSC